MSESMDPMDPMAAAVEAAAKAVYIDGGIPDWTHVHAFDRKDALADARIALEAARPLIPEAQALARVRALCAEWDNGPPSSWCAARDLRAAIEGIR